MMTDKRFRLSIIAVSAAVVLGCSGDGNDFSDVQPTLPPAPPAPVVPPAPVPAFDTDGSLDANIRWTTYGVPHVTADNLESLAFGVGYAFANDNMCILADQILKFNSQRSKYFGPDAVVGSGDSANLINDFGYLTIGIRELAESNFAGLSANTRAMTEGYAAGYNKYIAETPLAEQDPQCAGQPWVQPITAIDVYNFSLGVALLPGAANFLAPMFIAAPDGVDPLPVPAQANKPLPFTMKPKVQMPEANPREMGSNGWGLGSDLTENGMGMVLANPHFPHTGNLRFWQFHSIIPGHLNVLGGSLSGVPGAVNIGFNENMAWTHTFSTAEHFVVYQMSLDEDDPSSLTHLVDGNKRIITPKTMTIDVAVGPGATIKLQKTSYTSSYGPVIEVPGSFDWAGGNAFAIKDVNLPNSDIVDHWLAMNLSSNMDEFKQAFKDHDGVIFNNTMAASKDGEVFYIDDSTVPRLTATAINQLTTNPLLIGIKQQAGFTVLPGLSSQFDFDISVPYEEAPKYEGTDYVQNSNDSFWLANLENPIEGVSPLYGQVGNQQSLRSRHGHFLIANGAGADGKFSAAEVEAGLLSNTSYLGLEVLNPLLEQCQAQGSDPVSVDGVDVDISAACSALALWDGTMNVSSVGAHVFREFAFQFNRDPQWAVPYDVADPANTPSGLVKNDTTLAQFAKAVQVINTAGVAADAEFGTVQFVERSLPNGAPSGVRLPWAGSHNVEGGFNVFRTETGNNGTLLPRHTYANLPGTNMSAEGQGYHINYGSSWMFVMNFTEEGPQGRGILTYSQSRVQSDENATDQTVLYSQMPQLRPLYYTDADIEANKVNELDLSSQ